jgi:hypothetical protein
VMPFGGLSFLRYSTASSPFPFGTNNVMKSIFLSHPQVSHILCVVGLNFWFFSLFLRRGFV